MQREEVSLSLAGLRLGHLAARGESFSTTLLHTARDDVDEVFITKRCFAVELAVCDNELEEIFVLFPRRREECGDLSFAVGLKPNELGLEAAPLREKGQKGIDLKISPNNPPSKPPHKCPDEY